MLYSAEKCVKGKRPVFAAWFGNFFEPYFSSREAIEKGLQDLKRLGINSIVLDSKLWSDFTHYFQTGEASPYVQMQNFIREKSAEYGLGVSFLALFAMGDNLYPEIYDHPPEFVEQPVDFHGRAYRGYRHWSRKQMEEHVRHCIDLYKHIAKDAASRATDENGQERWPFYFYHSPIFAPSFDAEGHAFYLTWLKTQYSLEELNVRYGTEFSSVEELTATDYWVNPNPVDEGQLYTPAPEDYEKRTAAILKYADNQRFKQWVMRDYFAEVTGRLRKIEPRLFFYSALSQWKYFFNDFVHIQNRGWDLWELGKHLDSPSFITMPVDNHGEIEPYVVPCEMAMLRSAAEDKDFVGSLFIGRYMLTDLYAVCSPAEVIASALGVGATELYFYGYNGLDDGGNFEKWPEEKKQSLKQSLDWFSDVREHAGKRVKTHGAAILFPLASYTLSSKAADSRNYNAFRTDLLGWYRQLADLGLNPDVLHPSQVKAGALQGYKVLAIPADPHYWAISDKVLEKALRDFVAAGGILLHSVSELVQNTFTLSACRCEPDSFQWEEKVVTESAEFVSYSHGKPEAVYIGSGKSAYASQPFGAGMLHSFGFHYGFAYCCKTHLPVSRAYKKENHYPFSVTARTFVDKLLTENGLSKDRCRGVERIAFEHGELIINHTPYTFETNCGSNWRSTFEGFNGCHLPGRHAVFIGR